MPASNNKASRGGNLPAIGRGLVAAVVAGLIGTSIHSSLNYAGDIPILWGVAVAWLLLGVLVYWACIASGKIFAGAIGLIGCYVTVGLIAYVGHDFVILPMQYLQLLPGPTLASLLWMYGMIIPAICAMLLAVRRLRKLQR